MGDAVQRERRDAGIEQDVPARARRRIAGLDRIQIGDQPGLQAFELPSLAVHNLCAEAAPNTSGRATKACRTLVERPRVRQSRTRQQGGATSILPSIVADPSALVPFILIGFAAQLVDGALGMAYGQISSTLLISMGVPPAAASAGVHTAETFTTAVSGDQPRRPPQRRLEAVHPHRHSRASSAAFLAPMS